MKLSNKKKNSRKASTTKEWSLCPNCKKVIFAGEGHFVPPVLGDKGFFICYKKNKEYEWVQGCIDSYGKINSEATEQIEIHDGDLMRGKRWRWNIRRQEFCNIAPRTVEELNNRHLMVLTEEETFSVVDHLIKKGFAEDHLLEYYRPCE